MSKIDFSKYLKSTDEYSQIKLTEFVTNLNEQPYFYNSVIEHKTLIENLIDDSEVDFCLLEFQSHFDIVASDLFQIDLNEVKNELRRNNKTANAILTAFEITPRLAEKATRTLVWYKMYFKAILQKILDVDVLHHDFIFGCDIHDDDDVLENGKFADIFIHKPALLQITSVDFIDSYESILLEELGITPEEYKQIFEFPFALLFDVGIKIEGQKNLIRKPFLMSMGRDLFFMFDSVTKHRFTNEFSRKS
ncbi:hypothetical protein [Moheibacter lacus]|uniref:Uncharacterized protein n=1 Tax=Moheibacter lacus TaxID=2745851 RepID=A0A838ZK06_9FLAO|nr:hypothetical protein [Moheibacter lacus]MBA5628704.1 hypothetical protein [Moheibacter lacus]